MGRNTVAIFIIAMFALAISSPALAQFELDPPKGYEESDGNTDHPNQLTQSEIADRMGSDRDLPDFYFRYLQQCCRLSHTKVATDDKTFLFPWQRLEDLGIPVNPSLYSDIAVYGLSTNKLEVYATPLNGEPYLSQTLEFPPLSAEYVWLVDLTGDGRNEIVISGMTGISNGGGAYVFRMTDGLQLEPIMEDFDGEAWPQQLWSFYGSMELLRTPEGKWVFQGITPVGRNLSEYFWSYFYEWDETFGRFTTEGPSFAAEKQQQREFFQLLGPVLQDFQAHPGMYYIDDPQLDFHYGFVRDAQYYSLECYLGDGQEPDSYLIEETLGELRYLLNPQEYD